MAGHLQNWAGNHTYGTANVLYPATVAELQSLVAHQPSLRVLGSRHSFNSIADSTTALVSLERFTPTVSIDHARKQATISANVTYGHLCPLLHEAGFALHNMASLPHISVAGAVATATHGSGVGNKNLAAQVAALQFVAADGHLVSLARGDAGFEGAVVGLGALGVVVRLTLDLLPAFEMRQYVALELPNDTLDANFDVVMSAAYSVSLFTDWTHDAVNQVWLKHRSADGDLPLADGRLFGAALANRHMHPIGDLPADACTLQLGIPGPWHERLPHFRIDATPSAGNELQSEYFVPRRHAVEAIRAVRSLHAMISPHLLISEIRAIAADDFWLSPAYEQDCIGIHFTWKQDWPSVRAVLPHIEAALEPFGAKPHWGKLFTFAPSQLQPRYARLEAFRALAAAYDPHGKLRNAFVQDALYLA